MSQIQVEAFAAEQRPTNKETHYPLFCSVRLTYTVCAFLAMIMHLCMRNIFDFTILCMVETDAEVNVKVSGNESTNFAYTTINNSNSNENLGNIAWTRQEEFAIQSTFYYGYLVTLPFAGRLADRFGGKLFFIHSVTIQAVLFMLIPTFAHITYLGTSVIRLLQGLVSSNCIPWTHILKSAPVYGFILTHILHSYGIIVFTMMLPRFMKEALGFTLSKTGIYASMPFLGGIIAKIIIFPACRYIEKKPNYKPTLYGKIFYVLCNIFTIKFLIVVMLLNANQRILINLCILFVGIFSDMAFSAGYWPSLLHLTPSYAGLLSGIANAFSTMDGFFSPIIISAIAVQGTKSEWNYVMFTLIIAYLLAAMVFGALGSSKLRSWNNISTNEDV
ncbi:sialin isoform X2 [Bactrocera oleae]|uniref:sialin isoform X2 n=1 Tax=Bactrocera oleae TaxID=104688 RepID=UPI0006B8169D